MRQVNVGGQNDTGIQPMSVCLLCDWNPGAGDLWEKHLDLCACCDSFDWVESDE